MKSFLVIARALCVTACVLLSPAAQAEQAVRGRIQMVQSHLPQGLVYVHLKGYPQVSGGGCQSQFIVGKMDDPNFKAYVFSTILSAKAADAEVVLRVNGCYLGYPLIVGIDYSPRE